MSSVRYFGLCLVVVMTLVLTGTSCRPSLAPPAGQELPTASTEIDMDKLRDRIDAVLDYTLANRRLNTKDHAAWQILHGALAYQAVFPVENDGKYVSAVQHVLDGGKMEGWTMERGSPLPFVGADGEKRYGLRALLEQGTKTGQGHNDQWLAILSQCNLSPETTIQFDGNEYTVADFVGQVQLDLSRNFDHEYSWTLIALTAYLPTTTSWVDSAGKQWSIPGLVQAEVDHGFGSGACGGTHRLIGLSMALNRHTAQNGEMTPEWVAADDRIQEAIRKAREYQNPNGALSSNYFLRPGSSPDLAEDIGTTGHTLEFLSLSLTEEELNKPWVARAAQHMCKVFEQTEGAPLECGALYHAAHGLVLYRERVFGPREYKFELTADPGASTSIAPAERS
ncbi:ADP-ribosylation factor-directed GTPase activating protein isoform b [Blastopirellula sp. JC732]|uniref:ADP-ribosylation factor-directed GTPase activating protein isoform b n=1 Tax=Blastopirellula sediminis TaxID=2894196 RepID=A0A9X1SKJ7_9BACT|nr:ADP-ribosylation factor-directed GTPase activating protein isoform b [Blastopirellula sediminis]MCC9606885.1 ADP-ribosylation factor-directed GTPase activating protein isoform b [Blastopirellula sediminis]MCC9629819.1 ADP-ribosylation factor-directed GTPase activating protein isoform b [Blastopirellula sediminis]